MNNITDLFLRFLNWLWSLSGVFAVASLFYTIDLPAGSPEKAAWVVNTVFLGLLFLLALLFCREDR